MRVVIEEAKLKFIRVFDWGVTAKIGASGKTQEGQAFYADISVKSTKATADAMRSLTETDTPTLIGFFGAEQYAGKDGVKKTTPCLIVQECITGKQTAPTSRPKSARPAVRPDSNNYPDPPF